MGRPQLNLAQICNQRTRALLRHHHRKVLGFRWKRHNRAKWDRDGRMRNFTETDRSDHARSQTTVAIAYCHFNGKDSVSYIGRWGDACNPPLHWSGIILCLDRQFLSQTYSTENIVGGAKGYLYATDVSDRKSIRGRGHQAS